MGTAQHLGPLDVEELEELTRRRVHVDAILVDGNGARGVGVEIIESDTANEKRWVAGSKGGIDLKIRGEIR